MVTYQTLKKTRKKKMSRYKFDTTDTSQENLPITITEGKYVNMTYRYNSVQFKEDEDQMKMIFKYDIINNPTDMTIEELDESEEVRNLLGDLLLEIFDDELGRGDDFLRETDYDWTCDSWEFNKQWRIF